ncbi:PAAR domain-containing protein, partial [Geofilum rubicundum]|uniref:PAAR domain-containing protein n=1 Tax=Geofilum rubicundum TaxID=472113 RepID=UPI000A7AD984
LVPHVGGPVAGPGAPNVLINGKPAALMGDVCVCAGPPDTIVQGEPTVLINGVPVATMGSMTAHGGSIVAGEPNVLIGSGSTSKLPPSCP